MVDQSRWWCGADGSHGPPPVVVAVACNKREGLRTFSSITCIYIYICILQYYTVYTCSQHTRKYDCYIGKWQATMSKKKKNRIKMAAKSEGRGTECATVLSPQRLSGLNHGLTAKPRFSNFAVYSAKYTIPHVTGNKNQVKKNNNNK